MTKQGLIKEIHVWASELQYWEQYLASKILDKQKIGEDEIKTAYSLFLEDNSLTNKTIKREVITLQGSEASEFIIDSNFALKEIKDIKGVNALKENQSVPISSGLTIIYGDNGVGKSGYIRLMNNAFVSRGDKNMVPNIYLSGKPPQPSCVFKFIAGDKEYELIYPDQRTKYEFSCYAVFDNWSSYAHLNEESEIQFMPNGIDFFDGFTKATEKVKTLLEIQYAASAPENPFLVYFEKETSTKKIIEELSGKTDIKIVKEKASLSKDEIEELEQLEKTLLELRKTDIQKKVKSLKQIKSLLEELLVDFNELNKYFSEAAIESYKKLIADYNFNKELSAKEGLTQFKTDKLKNIGSKEWKELIIAADEFAQTQHEKNKYPTKDDVCLLCQQPLSKEAGTLLESYWKYLSSNAEKEAVRMRKNIDDLQSDLKDLDMALLEKDGVIYQWLGDNFKPVLDSWVEKLSKINSLKKQINAALKAKQWNDEIKAAQIETKAISTIDKSIDGNIGQLNEADVTKKIKETEKKIDELKDRKKLTPLLSKIEDYVKKHAWAINAAKKTFTTRKITAKQKELFTKYVTDEYVEVFNKECKRLNAQFGIEISQRSQKGNTLKHLILKGKTPSAILSEGEQRAISLADFLAEIQMGNKNKGIIFDDPVNSLDHRRRQIIAERLIEEAKIRQVIIFTHDLTFLLALQALSEERNTDHVITTIRKISGTPGIINHSIPWLAANVKFRIKRLNEILQELKKTEKSGDVDKYCFDAKTWTGLLRETWERAIEEKLFNDAIQRLSPSIQTQRLEKAKFTPDLYKEIKKGMSECSNWVHDQARAINTPTPNTTELESFINDFMAFVRKLD
jgi:energy-coupling factor transporter ATP-binding protein EcfA2